MTSGEQRPLSFEPFIIPDGDPLAAAHKLTMGHIEEAVKSDRALASHLGAELRSVQSGTQLLNASPAESRLHVLALIAQAEHWERQLEQLRSQVESSFDKTNIHLRPEGMQVLLRQQQAMLAIRTLLRRHLQLESGDLIALARWMTGLPMISSYAAPVNTFIKAVGRYLQNETGSPGQELRQAVLCLADKLEASYDKMAKIAGGQLRATVGDSGAPPQALELGTATEPSAEKPVPAARPAVLSRLKQLMGMGSNVTEAPTTEIGPDHFPLRDDSPFKEEHRLLTELFEDVIDKGIYHEYGLDQSPTGQTILRSDVHCRADTLLSAAERVVHGHLHQHNLDEHRRWKASYAAIAAFNAIISREHECDRRNVFDLFLFMTSIGSTIWLTDTNYVSSLITQVEETVAASPLAPDERHILHRLRARLVQSPPLGHPTPNVVRLTRLLGDGAMPFLVPGEGWSDVVNADLTSMRPAEREAWLSLLAHALNATGSTPSEKWSRIAAKHLKVVGNDSFTAAMQRWIPAVSTGRSVRLLCDYVMGTRDPNGVMNEANANALRGLSWMASLTENEDICRSLGELALSCYRKVPGVGPRAVKVGNAAVYSLSRIGSPGALAQLARLRVAVKFGTAKGLAEVAARTGTPREDIEEMAVPAYGLSEVGVRREQLGDCTAELAVTVHSGVELRWSTAKGKQVKSVPALVKKDCPDDLKELKTAAKDIEQMLSAQRERLDQLFLQRKSWPVPIWRERYLDHPLVGTLARRLIWRFTSRNQSVNVLFHDGRFVNAEDQPVELASEETKVELWHPIISTREEILAWRSWLEEHEVRQPFKQAHREIYLLTDAERTTTTYSNRFAAHILKQHQFNALCAARGWKNSLRLMVDQDFPPATRLLQHWDLRAEFWIEGIGEEYGQDTNETGTYYYVSTDQVRFHQIEAAGSTAHAGGGGYRTANVEPISLEQIPPLVLSEVMRDVDLFVGVASVGNDPTWQDGGPQGRYRDYWTSYSFGVLGESAQTRRQVLQRLVPRLKIADRCSFNDRFLIVRGDLRTYKIHLGSGNILMEPNDQYLCIVARQSQEAKDRVFLPFEGDQMLSVILSKAMLLAEDAKIKDATITSQIARI